jgi:hypothetical protein
MHQLRSAGGTARGGGNKVAGRADDDLKFPDVNSPVLGAKHIFPCDLALAIGGKRVFRLHK